MKLTSTLTIAASLIGFAEGSLSYIRGSSPKISDVEQVTDSLSESHNVQRQLQAGVDITTYSSQVNISYAFPFGFNPDCAAGHDTVVGVSMFNIEAVNKTGGPIFSNSLRWLFDDLNLEQGASLTSPRVIYDSDSNRMRFIVAAALTDKETYSKIVLAISRNGTPESGTSNDWYYVVINTLGMVDGVGNVFADDLSISLDSNAIYLTSSMKHKVTFEQDDFVHSKLFILEKNPLYSQLNDQFLNPGQPLFVNNEIDNQILKSETILSMTTGGTTTYIGPYVPASIENDSTKQFGKFGTYLVAYNHDFAASANEELHVIRVSMPTSQTGPITQEYTVDIGDIEDTSVPLPNVAQPNPEYDGVQTGERKVHDAAWYDEKLHVVLTITDTNGQTAVQYIKIDANSEASAPTSLSQTAGEGGIIDAEDISTGASAYYPSIAVNKMNQVLIGFGASGSLTYSGMYAKLVSDAGAQSEALFEGESDLESIDGLAYHGKYSGNAVDPVDDCFWVFNTYSRTVEFPDLLHQWARGSIATGWAKVCPSI